MLFVILGIELRGKTMKNDRLSEKTTFSIFKICDLFTSLTLQCTSIIYESSFAEK